MLTVIAEIRTRPGQHHRQAVLDQFAKIIPTVLQEAGCHGYAPLVDHAAGVSFQTTAIMDMLLAKKRSEDRRNWLQEKGDMADLEV